MHQASFHEDFAFIILFAFTFFTEKMLSLECVLVKQSKENTPKYTVLKQVQTS